MLRRLKIDRVRSVASEAASRMVPDSLIQAAAAGIPPFSDRIEAKTCSMLQEQWKPLSNEGVLSRYRYKSCSQCF